MCQVDKDSKLKAAKAGIFGAHWRNSTTVGKNPIVYNPPKVPFKLVIPDGWDGSECSYPFFFGLFHI